MSGIVELAYTVLLGWMRAVFDWFWAMVSGRSSGGGWQWFLSNWKAWLIVLLIGGLVIDWLTWVVRWRPYRVLFSRFRKTPAQAVQGAEMDDGPWDDGAGYYAPEMAVDTPEPDWADSTYATLSEIDPDWAGGLMISDEDEPSYFEANTAMNPTGFYAEQYEEPPEAEGFAMDGPEMGYWDETPDEQAFAAGMTPEDLDPFAPYDEAYDDEAALNIIPPPADPGPFVEERYYEAPEALPEEVPPPQEAIPEDTLPGGMLQFGRPSIWPGAQFPFAMQGQAEEPPPPEEPAPVMDAEPPAPPEPYDPLFNPDAEVPQEPQPRRRRRRRLREIAPEVWQPEDPIPETPAAAAEPEPVYSETEYAPQPEWLEPPPEDDPAYGGYEEPISPYAPVPFDDRVVAYIGPDDVAPPPPREPPRPSRLVRPPSEVELEERLQVGKDKRRKDKKGIRTVTGKPALRKGFMRLTTAQDEPIPGLPPLQLTDPFLPAVQPEDVDFAPDDGDEY